ncbi:MAG: zinc ribbon domain-containing protein [Ruminococcus sp.]|nr:zinc ribbon domain-containing protein [Ruminococcus sp.]
MDCPKCGKSVSSEDYNCIYCGTLLKTRTEPEKKKLFGGKDKSEKKTKEKKKIFSGEKKDMQKTDPASDLPKLTDDTEASPLLKKIKIAAAVTAAVLIVVLAVIVVLSIRSGKGERYAQDASEFIGKGVAALNDSGDRYYGDNSAYNGVNTAVKFDCITESDKHVTVQGVKYPAWAVTLKLSSVQFITDVTYTDFSLLKKDIRGVKADGLVSLERFHEGDKQSSVLKEIDMDPYSIPYSQSGITTYTYKYYFKQDNGDEQAVILRASFDEDGKYKYSTTELLIQENM